MFLSSKDVKRADTGHRSHQVYCAHEMGHFLVGYGMDVHPWHGFAWLDALQRVTQGPGGHDYRRTNWTVEPA